MKSYFHIAALLIIISNQLFAQAIVYIDPPMIKLTSENVATVNVKIAAVNDLRSYSVIVVFNNSILDITNLRRGAFLRSSGASQTLFAPQPTVSNIIGNFDANEVMFPEFSTGEFLTASGNGTLFSIDFNILESGISSITIESVILKDSNNINIPVDFSSGSIVVKLPVKVKTFFEGPFSVDKMNTGLNLNGMLPLIQPYSISPWNYSGSENVASGFFSSHPNIVDWVLIELRTGLAQSSKVGSQAAFILEDGSIVGLDGISPIYFEQSAGNYNIVITHRNHLSIMTPGLQTIERASGVYDFSSSQVNALGALPMVELAAGIYGMYAGDANSDGQLTGTDFNIYNPDFRSAVSGYRITDFNLDGSVTGSDFNLFNPNFRNAKSSFVPK
jgi:hypothetical protein